MRLTLRTMLAYMDDILEPTDAEVLGHKIEESEFATDLVNRVRDVTRRLRIGAPKLFGRGMGGDPNSVAEYLDNTLPGERVPEFERVCLESDMYLAEVASCHQILTLVLGEPAQVEPASRSRMYRIAGSDQSRIDGPELLTAVQEPREKPAIPDYLREERSWSRTLVPVAAAVVLIGGLVWAVWQAVGPLPLALREGDAVGEAGEAPLLAPEVVDEGVVDDRATEKVDLEEADAEVVVAAPEVPLADASLPLEPLSDVVTPTEEGEGTAADEEAMELETPPQPDASIAPANVVSSDVVPEEVGEEEMESDRAAPRVASRPSEVAPPLAEGDTSPVSRTGVGRLLSNTDVMLRYRPTGETSWEQLPGGEMVFGGDRLLAMPGFGSTVALSQGVTVRLMSGSAMELPESSEADIPTVDLLLGRAVLMTAGRAGARVRLRTAQQSGELVFRDAETTIALEVSSRWATGLSPEKEPLPAVVDLYVTRGRLAWIPAEGDEEIEIPAPAYQRWDGGEVLTVDTVEPLPTWTGGVEELTQIDERAVGAMKVHLQPDRPVELTLRELASNRRPEVVSLAVRCLAYMGEYAPLIDTLNDQGQRGSWDEHIRVLTNLGARDDRSAAAVRTAFEARRPAGAAELNRMLWGYTDEQLRGGAAAQLVELLDHEHLDLRVLAFWNLSRITGFTLYYRPEYPAPRREQYVQKWRQKLDAGLVVPKDEPL